MVLLSARDLCRQFDVDPVFREVTFDLRAGDKIGLVGPNGCGKTTLLSILAGREEPDVGQVETAGGVRIGYLEQHSEPPSTHTLADEARIGLKHLYELQQTAHDLAERMATTQDAAEEQRLHDRYDEIHLELTRLDAYHIEHRIDEVLQGLGFQPEDYGRPLATFSGGQQNRAALARLLLAAPEALLLDEPTNHLDIDTTEWLERYLTRSTQAMIIVSHDRYFLDQVTNRTIELWQGGISDYSGNFSAYWRQRDDRLKVLRRTYEKQQEYIARQEEFIRRNFAGQKAAQAKDREKKLERIDRITLPPDFHEIPMGFPSVSRTGDWVLRAEGLAKGFAQSAGEGKPRPLFHDLTVQIDRGDRVAILGPNGSGKTTLLRTLLGELTPDHGAVRFGTGVQVAYFDQQLVSADISESAIEAVRAPEPSIHQTPFAKSNPYITPGEVRSLLARFGVSGELALQTVGQMSGGERTKVALARLAALKPNVMILDEPTNHLDFWACAALEESLRAFDGTLLFVSHDRYFVDQIATKVIVLEASGWRLHEGNYSDLQHFLAATRIGRDSAAAAVQAPAASEPSSKKSVTKSEASPARDQKKERRKRKFPYRTVEAIEADIADREAEIADLEVDLASPEVLRDGDRTRQVHRDYARAQEELAQLMEHWEEALELN
ncbi:MAG: ABC-F family ATP-binding cassette domain-containing protein [Planctomycetaceae bacterium]|nr:ABC-F family ATP-binding cassette domain-containing protein [Planctomycetaceae bacterium]